MEHYGQPGYQQRFWDKAMIFIEEIWPTVYTLINDFFYGVINFFKFLIRGFFPGGR